LLLLLCAIFSLHCFYVQYVYDVKKVVNMDVLTKALERVSSVLNIKLPSIREEVISEALTLSEQVYIYVCVWT
jgi:hypothetical protein